MQQPIGGLQKKKNGKVTHIEPGREVPKKTAIRKQILQKLSMPTADKKQPVEIKSRTAGVGTRIEGGKDSTNRGGQHDTQNVILKKAEKTEAVPQEL